MADVTTKNGKNCPGSKLGILKFPGVCRGTLAYVDRDVMCDAPRYLAASAHEIDEGMHTDARGDSGMPLPEDSRKMCM